MRIPYLIVAPITIKFLPKTQSCNNKEQRVERQCLGLSRPTNVITEEDVPKINTSRGHQPRVRRYSQIRHCFHNRLPSIFSRGGDFHAALLTSPKSRIRRQHSRECSPNHKPLGVL